jgi:hypothetical protein
MTQGLFTSETYDSVWRRLAVPFNGGTEPIALMRNEGGVFAMSDLGKGFWTSTGTILVLFILLVIVICGMVWW